MTKTKNVSAVNPIIAMLAPFYAAAGVDALRGDGTQDTGQDRQVDRTVQAILNFLCNTIYRQLYEPIVTANGSMPNLKDRMDQSDAKLRRIQEEYQDTPQALMGDPRALIAAYNLELDTARFESIREILMAFQDAYQYHTGHQWEFVPQTNTRTQQVAAQNLVGRAALEKFLKTPQPATTAKPPKQAASAAA